MQGVIEFIAALGSVLNTLLEKVDDLKKTPTDTSKFLSRPRASSIRHSVTYSVSNDNCSINPFIKLCERIDFRFTEKTKYGNQTSNEFTVEYISEEAATLPTQRLKDYMSSKHKIKLSSTYNCLSSKKLVSP